MWKYGHCVKHCTLQQSPLNEKKASVDMQKEHLKNVLLKFPVKRSQLYISFHSYTNYLHMKYFLLLLMYDNDGSCAHCTRPLSVDNMLVIFYWHGIIWYQIPHPLYSNKLHQMRRRLMLVCKKNTIRNVLLKFHVKRLQLYISFQSHTNYLIQVEVMGTLVGKIQYNCE